MAFYNVASARTWNRDKELDGVPVTVEGELRLRHGAVGDKAFGRQLIFAIRIDPHGSTRHHPGLLLQRVLDGGAFLHRRGVGRGDGGRVVQGHGDDYPVPGAHPKTEVRHQQGCDPDKGKAQLASTCNNNNN